MRMNLLDRVSFRGGWFVVSLEIDVPETHGELSGGESAHECRKIANCFIQLRISERLSTNEQLTAVGDDRACNAPR